MTTNRCLTVAAALIILMSKQPAAQHSGGNLLPTRIGLSARASGTPMRPGTHVEAVGLIQGNALSSTNAQLANVMVRLRDARYGMILGNQITDNVGLFAFKVVEPGTYIVEMVDANSAVVAASQVLNINAGEAVSTVVKLPFRAEPFLGMLGHTSRSAVAVTSQAAASNILSVTTSGAPTCDQGQGSS